MTCQRDSRSPHRPAPDRHRAVLDIRLAGRRLPRASASARATRPCDAIRSSTTGLAATARSGCCHRPSMKGSTTITPAPPDPHKPSPTSGGQIRWTNLRGSGHCHGSRSGSPRRPNRSTREPFGASHAVDGRRQIRRSGAVPTALSPDVLAQKIFARVLARSAYSQGARDRRQGAAKVQRVRRVVGDRWPVRAQ